MNHERTEQAVHWSASGPIPPPRTAACAQLNTGSLVSRLSTFGNVVALVAGGALVAWVIGLLIVLRESEPDKCSEIIHAYAHCNPLVYLRRNTAPRGESSVVAPTKGRTATVAARQITRGWREIVARSSTKECVAMIPRAGPGHDPAAVVDDACFARHREPSRPTTSPQAQPCLEITR
jgi:hypothetical protein